jgi:hypothetical protein
MILRVDMPSAMEAALVDSKNPQNVVSVRPRRYSKGQRKVAVLPFSVISEDGKDRMLDQGYISVDMRTGKISVEHRCDELMGDEAFLKDPK